MQNASLPFDIIEKCMKFTFEDLIILESKCENYKTEIYNLQNTETWNDLVHKNLKTKFQMFCASSEALAKGRCHHQIVKICLVCKPIYTAFHLFIDKYVCLFIEKIPLYKEEWYNCHFLWWKSYLKAIHHLV